RAIAGTGAKRSDVTPNVPTLQEMGLPGFDATSWNGIFARAGTSNKIIERLNVETNAVLSQPAIKRRLIEIGLVASGGTAAELHARLKEDIVRWKEVIAQAGIERQ